MRVNFADIRLNNINQKKYNNNDNAKIIGLKKDSFVQNSCNISFNSNIYDKHYNQVLIKQKINLKHLTNKHPKNSNNSKLSFGFAPWRLSLSSLGIPESGSLSAQQAIKVFEKFKLGNYLDYDGGSDSYSNQLIREENLKFLERVTDLSEKKQFIDYYKKLTGFPDLQNVSGKITLEFVNAITKAESILKKEFPENSTPIYNYCLQHYPDQEPAGFLSNFDVLCAGYDGACSVARKKALPGSDLDKAYVVLRGSEYSYQNNIEIANLFKEKLWKNTDQRILSYNQDAAFPQIYTTSQINGLLDAIESKTQHFGLHDKIDLNLSFWEKLFNSQKTTTQFNKYIELLKEYKEDYVKVNPFFIRLCKEFPRQHSSTLNPHNPSKEDIKNFGFFIEAFMRGDYFTTFEEKHHFRRGNLIAKKLQNSDASNLVNLSQIYALRNRNDVKPKRIAREKLQSEFETWSTDKQYRFVKTLIKSSCNSSANFTTEFPEYFQTGKDHFAPLLKTLRE
ncbi:MAG: hypothetical protein PHV68_04855 [Candidatus Gastranaerophilales bacterium]|nr:hypothetical protein [Candidatus Gastranaerophilales bacterium]